jgi:uncharacterized protein
MSSSEEAPLPAGAFLPWLALTRRAQQQRTEGAEVPCGSCTGCCRASYFIHIRPEETGALRRIPRRLLFRAPGLPEGHLLMGYNAQGECPMLRDGKCTIYEDRPQTCRDFDCRVFAATGISLDADGPQAGIAERARRWRFDQEGAEARASFSAVRAAAAFLQEREALFPPDALPRNPAQLAALAIRVHELFRELDAGDGARDRRSVRNTDEQIARAVLEELGAREASASAQAGEAPPATAPAPTRRAPRRGPASASRAAKRPARRR